MRGRMKGGVAMKRSMIGMLLLLFVFTGSAAVLGGQMPMGGQGGPEEQPSGQSPMMGRGMMGMPMMGMMCPMMGGPMDPMMMAMMAGGQMDPKAMGRMLELRGGLLKAIGD